MKVRFSEPTLFGPNSRSNADPHTLGFKHCNQLAVRDHPAWLSTFSGGCFIDVGPVAQPAQSICHLANPDVEHLVTFAKTAGAWMSIHGAHAYNI